MWLHSEMNFACSPGVNGRFLLSYQLYYLLRRLYYLQNKVCKKKKKWDNDPFIMCVLSRAWLFVTHRLQPVRPLCLSVKLLCPWDFSSRNTGVGCHFLFQGIFTTQVLTLLSPVSPELQADSFPMKPSGKPLFFYYLSFNPFLWLPWCLDGKESSYKAGDPGLIPGFRRFPREGHGNPLQCFCLENPVDRGAWIATTHGVTKNQTRLNT